MKGYYLTSGDIGYADALGLMLLVVDTFICKKDVQFEHHEYIIIFVSPPKIF